MRVLITGGAGFVGSNLACTLAEEHELGIIDDLSTGLASNVPEGVWFREMDILDDGLPEAMAKFGPDVVVHLAAQASVAESTKDPVRDWAVNAEGTGAVAAAAAAAGAFRMLSASSAAVYGDPVELPLPENAQKLPLSPYGRSKLAAEEILAETLAPTKVDFASMRFSNVYGPRQDWRGEGGVVAVFCAMMSEGRAPVIHGSGEQTRDFIYVGDVVAALAAAVLTEASLKDGDGTGPAYNISAGTRTSINDLAAIVAEATGFDRPIKHDRVREGDIVHSALDSRKARTVFAWDARVPLRVGIRKTVDWLMEPR